ncbi:MAG: hypothetical protein Q9196_002295 [Gyalolechia fulgens]
MDKLISYHTKIARRIPRKNPRGHARGVTDMLMSKRASQLIKRRAKLSVYIGSAIYSAGTESVVMTFGVSQVKATLGLTYAMSGTRPDYAAADDL